MMSEPSLIQRCPICRKYYFYDGSHPRGLKRRIKHVYDTMIQSIYDEFDRADSYSRKEEDMILAEKQINGFGALSFEEMDSAYASLYSDDLPIDKKKTLLFMWLFAFNDKYNGRNDESNGAIELPLWLTDIQQTVILRIVNQLDISNLVYSELVREAGMFEECIAIIGDLASYDGHDSSLARQILEHAQRHDRRVFKIEF